MPYYGEIYNKPVVIPEGFHVRMVNSSNRLQVYLKAYDEVGVNDKVVCDLGAGTGILGLEALSRGASHVYLVEMNEHSLVGLNAIVAAHPHRDKITVISKDICNLTAEDFSHNVDVIVSETLGGQAYNEGIVIYFKHVLDLFPDAITIPYKIESRFRTSDALYNNAELWPQLGDKHILEGYKTLYNGKFVQLILPAWTDKGPNDMEEILSRKIIPIKYDSTGTDVFDYEFVLEEQLIDGWLVLSHVIHYSTNVIDNWSHSGWFFKNLQANSKVNFNLHKTVTVQLSIEHA